MKTIKFLTYAAFVLFLGLAISSCKGDDGADGIDGAVGTTGADGPNGNANVQTLTYDISTESGYSIYTTVPEFTQSVIDNDAILFYLKVNNSYLYSIPGPIGTIVVQVVSSVGTNIIAFQNWDGVAFNISQGALTTLKIVIIESTSSKSAGNNNPQQEIYTELKNAGVDINNYQDVCDYYDINP